MSDETGDPHGGSDPRRGCHGVVALTARLEPWQLELCRDPGRLARMLDRHGSPLNLLDPSPIARNANELTAAADATAVDLKIHFARKANKALAFVDEALRLGLGVDVASERELAQTLQRGVPASEIIVTAAVKPAGLLELCVAAGVTVVVDNEDELHALTDVAERARRRVPVALRLAPVLEGRRQTRFGLDAEELLAVVERRLPAGPASRLTVAGVHFHLDGYAANDRIAAIGQSLELIDALRERGHEPTFIDIGGGIPMSYLDDAEAWERFWEEHRAALLGDRAPLTFDGHGLGLVEHGGEIIGRTNTYPAFQQPIRGAWLEQILRSPVGGAAGTATIADALRTRRLQLRCEPGRCLVDGCGLTAARVEFRKQRRDGTWLIGVAMNRTQCRSAADDFLVDPLLLRVHDAPATGPIEGYLVGAYCIERELLTWRRMCFPCGVEVGDIVVFPNTAGYLMHILESASHQIPLARNLILAPGREPFLDPIDAPGIAIRGSTRAASGHHVIMTIGVEQFESWIGTEAHDSSGDKLGKIDDVYFAGAEPVAIAIRSGLAGRKHWAATLNGASVSHDGVHLAVEQDGLVSTDGGALTRSQLAALAVHDERLRDMAPEQLEGWQQREERHKEAEKADAEAEKLEAEVVLRAEEEEKAVARAGDAESNAEAARRQREEVEARAKEARAAADRAS